MTEIIETEIIEIVEIKQNLFIEIAPQRLVIPVLVEFPLTWVIFLGALVDLVKSSFTSTSSGSIKCSRSLKARKLIIQTLIGTTLLLSFTDNY